MKRIYNKDTRDFDLVPSEGYGPNKQLVSDADGNPKWEERTHYKETAETVILPETTCILAKDDEYDYPSFAIDAVNASEKIKLGDTILVAWMDGKTYECTVITHDNDVVFGDLYSGCEAGLFPFRFVVSNDGIEVSMGYDTPAGEEITFSLTKRETTVCPSPIEYQYDIIFDSRTTSSSTEEAFNWDNMVLVGMTFDELIAACYANKTPRVLFRQEFFYGRGYVWYGEPISMLVERDDTYPNIETVIYYNGSFVRLNIYKDSISVRVM